LQQTKFLTPLLGAARKDSFIT